METTITDDYITQAKRDYAMVSEYLKEDLESPTALVWAIDNHNRPWLTSFKVAGSVAGNLRDRCVNIKGIRIDRLRAIKMLRGRKPIVTQSADTGKPYRFIQKPSGYIESVSRETYKKMAYGGRRGKHKV